MDRLKLWLLPIYITAGFVAIVALIPNSRWILLTQLDVLAGRWRYIAHANDGLPHPDHFLQPIQRGLDDRDPAPDETAQFLRLVSPTQDSPNPDDYDKRFTYLFDICQRKNDVRYWAQFVRVASFQGLIPRYDQRTSISDHKNVQIKLKEACLAGEKLDPQNAYFPAILSGVLVRLHQEADARDALLKAAACPQYDDYVLFEPELRYKYLVDRYGNRGNQLKAIVCANTYLQHLSVLMSTARYFSKTQDPSARLAAIKLGMLMVDQSKSAIGAIVGRNIMTFGLEPSAKWEKEPYLDPKKLQFDISLFQAGLKEKLDQTAIAKTYAEIPKIPDWGANAEELSQIENLRPAFSACSLLSLLLTPAVIGFAYLKIRNPKVAVAAPYLIWLMALAAEALCGSDANPAILFGAASLLFIPALFDKTKKITHWLGLIVFGAALWEALSVPYLFAPAILFFMSMMAETRIKKIPLFALVWAAVSACVFAAATWVFTASSIDPVTGIFMCLLTTVATAAVIPMRKEIPWQKAAGATCAILGLWFGLTVYRDLAADKQMAAVSDKMLNDGSALRLNH